MRPPIGQPPVIINRPGFGGSGFGYGFQLPSFWMAPTYYISNYSNYSLPKPRNGNRWSRYYDGAVQVDRYGRVIDWREDVNWGRNDRGYSQYRDERYDDRPLDYGSQYPGDDRVFTGYDDRQVTESDYRGYDDRNDDRSYDRPGTRYPEPGYDTRSSGSQYSEEERYLANACRRDNGIGGGALGGILGGIAGNRIGGRGERLAGSLIGAGIGAAAGAIIDQAEDKRKCRNAVREIEERRSYEASRRAPPVQQGYPDQGYPAQTYPQQGYTPGYYYPTPAAPQITVINIPGNGGGNTSTTTTTTTSTYYETVAVRRPVVRKRVYKAKPRPKPRCVCH